jgi:Tfp pilus assembly protein PilX
MKAGEHMLRGNNRSRGFTLIAALLILILLSGVAVGLMFMVTNEVKMGGNDLQANVAYYGAESGMEKLTTDLAALYQSTMAPRNCDIYNLANTSANWPTAGMVGNLNYSETITGYATAGNLSSCSTKPATTWDTVSSGSNQGLVAELVPMTLTVTASRPGSGTGSVGSGATVTITRNIEVALVPVFQFGVFCGFDCSYFAGPDFSFGGRVHTNGNLFLAGGADLVFNDKVQAYKQIIRDRLENGWATTSNYTGTVYVPKASGGCPLNTFPPTGTNCLALPGVGTIPGDASWSGGYPTIGGTANPNFPSISSATFNYYLANSKTGVTNMQLPFVNRPCTNNAPPCTDPIAIIRKPVVGESPTGPIGSTRLYNKAQIRVLLADDPADLHPERGVAPIDSGDVQLPTTTTYSGGPFTSGYVTLSAGSGSSGAHEYLGFGKVGINGWVSPADDSGSVGWATNTQFPLMGELVGLTTGNYPVTGPWIRVEYLNSSGTWVPVTQEWLQLGFSRQFNAQLTTPQSSNMVDPNAILILQQLTPWASQSTVAQAQASGRGAGTQNNFFPINLYDAREGEMRDNPVLNQTNGNVQLSSCSVNGIMNAVEIDVGNLAKWLNGTIAGSGASVSYTSQNGYVLYFSDHRGMLKDPNPSNGTNTPAGVYSGESGIEDVVNSGQNFTSTTPDGVLEGATYYTYSPEDVDQNGFLDNWGEKNIGYGFGVNTNTSPLNPYQRVGVANKGLSTESDCAAYNTSTHTFPNNAKDQMGLANPVSGARHVLKLVDGGMNPAGTASYLPIMPAGSGCTQSAGANATGCGGFTVASENPVYVQGNYNTNSADPFWGTANNTTPSQTPHSAASIVADSVMLLSNQWTDAASMIYPDQPGSRLPSAPAYYRMAISGGKSIPFPRPGWTSAAQDLGTDGGMHNFLRYLENLGSQSLYYNGSLVSMYYAEYNTGIYKDGGGPNGSGVYSPPPRKYYFDVLFLNPNNLPPATPEFQDIDNLSYHQNFTPN